MLHCDPLPRLGETLNSQAAAMFLRARPASETEVRIVGARAAALAKVSFDRPCGGTVPNFRIQVRRKGYRLSPRFTDESNNRRWLLEGRRYRLRRRAIGSGPFSRTAISPQCCPDGIMFGGNRRGWSNLGIGRSLIHGVAPHMCGRGGSPLLDRGAGGRSPGFLIGLPGRDIVITAKKIGRVEFGFERHQSGVIDPKIGRA